MLIYDFVCFTRTRRLVVVYEYMKYCIIMCGVEVSGVLVLNILRIVTFIKLIKKQFTTLTYLKAHCTVVLDYE